MNLHLQKFSVSYEYPVIFTSNVFDPLNPHLVWAVSRGEPGRRQRLFVVIDHGVAAAWPSLTADMAGYVDVHRDRLALVNEPLILDGGEGIKNDPAAIERLHAELNRAKMDRHSSVVIVGGGALLDMAGYGAATCHRGLRVIRIPTTVLSQNDAGLSVKNGVNAFGKKNFVGTFSPPYAVLNDRCFLPTLSPRDRTAGMAEAVKASLIRDAEFFDWIVASARLLHEGAPAALQVLIERSAKIHLDHIARSGDPFEFGCARPLDFGHWAVHKLELLTRYRLRHGEAVAIGMAVDTLYSVLAGHLDEQSGRRILRLLNALNLRLWDDALGDPALPDGLIEFREHLGGELTITLLKRIGHGFEVHDLRLDLIRTAIDQLHDLEIRAQPQPQS